jgi:hypothetical protein
MRFELWGDDLGYGAVAAVALPTDLIERPAVEARRAAMMRMTRAAASWVESAGVRRVWWQGCASPLRKEWRVDFSLGTLMGQWF